MSEADRTAARRLLAVAEEARRDSGQDAERHERLRQELDRIRLALAHLSGSRDAEDAELGLRLASALRNFWISEPGLLQEGADWLATLLAHPAVPARTSVWSQAVDDAAALEFWRGDYVRARALEEESLAAERERGPSTGLVVRLIHLGILAALTQNDLLAADRFLREALETARARGDRWGTAAALDNLARLRLEQGEDAVARTMAEEAVSVYRELGHRRPTASALSVVATAAWHHGDYGTAQALLTESLAIARELQHAPFTRVVLERFAELAAAQGQVERALRLDGAAAALREAAPSRDMPGHEERHAREMAPARHGLDPAIAAARVREGKEMGLEAAAAYALGTTS